MRNIFKRVIAVVSCLVLGVTATVASAATLTTGYFSSYSQIASVPNSNSCPNIQGVAVGGTYVYTAKVNSTDTRTVLSKVNKNTGVRTVLKESSTGRNFATYLGHATDMDVTTIDGASNLYIATAKSNSLAIVRLKVSGNTVKRVGYYKVTLNGVSMGVTGVNVLNKADGKVNLLLRKNDTFYTGSIGINAVRGTIAITEAFKINTTNVVVNGKEKDLSSKFTKQGCGYWKDRIYLVFTNNKKPNVSIVAVYDIKDATGTVTSNPDLSFRIISNAYSMFEMEGCGISSSDGKLYFSVNRRVSDTDTNHDAIGCFKGYTYSK